MATGSDIRVGDAEREAVASQLREHYADGRLSLDELNERLDEAFAAKTRTDLGTVTRDLPAAPRPMAGSGVSTWQQATGSGSGYGPGAGSRQDFRRPVGAVVPLLAMFWLFVALGSLFIFGVGGGKPIAVVLFFAALAVLRKIFGGGRRGRGRGRR
jgi:hypothetical protein